MSLTEFAIQRDRITWVLVALGLLLGTVSFMQLPKQQDPGFTIRTAVITTRFPGASPERVERLVTDKIEKRIQEMPELDNLTSESRNGISIINANFKESYTNMRPIFDDLRKKVDEAERELPSGVGTPIVNDEFGDVFGSVYAITGDGFSFRELETVAEEIRDELLKEADIAKVQIHGVQEEVIYVEYSNARLTEYGIAPQTLTNTLSGVNVLSSGGNVLSGRERITLEPTGNFDSVGALGATLIDLPSGEVIRLDDVATVRRDYVNPASSFVRTNGARAISLAVSLRKGGDILKLGEWLDQTMPIIEARYPWGVSIHKIWFQAQLVEENVNNFTSSLMQAITIVVVVMVLFLGLRTGFIVATLIPTTMIITFYLMQLFDITVNQISLAALIIALGLLVDNAIVIVESILVKREQGVDALTAAVQSGAEMRTPLLISSLTTGAAFMPIALAESAVGEYTADIFYVVLLALLTSWVLAMTFIPLISMKFLNVGKTDSTAGARLRNMYRPILMAAMHHRGRTLALALLAFVLAILGMGIVPKIFIAPSEDPVLTARLEMPLGTSIETTSAVTGALDEFIRNEQMDCEQQDGSVQSWMTFVGDGGPRFHLSLDPPNPNAAGAFMVLSATDGKEVPQIITELNDFLFNNYPDMEARIARLENGPPVGYPIVIRILGEDTDVLYDLARSMTDKLYSLEGVLSVKNDWGLKTKKLIINVDQDLARRAGVTNQDIAYSLQTSLVGIDMTEYREGNDVIPVRLRSVASDREDIDKLYGLSIFSASRGQVVPLTQVARIDLAFEAGAIKRRDRSRAMTLKVQLIEGVTATEVNDEFIPWLSEAATTWPQGYSFAEGGEAETSSEATDSIAAKLPIAGAVILLLLVWQFNSIRRPIIVLTTIPLGIIGVTAGLLIGQSSFGFFTILGIISLSGIIINNAIVLLDRVRVEIDELGKAPDVAIVDACLQRLRPILLTTATTVLGMMPLWWGGTAMFEPMAISIIFGLAFATMLTLFVVPTLYSLMFGVKVDI